jgi:O-antigen ligase
MSIALLKGPVGVYLSTLLVSAIFWAQPFPGGPRIPTVLIMLLGTFFLVKDKITFSDQRLRRFVIILTLLFVPAILSVLNSYDRNGTLKLIFILPLFVPFAAAVLFLIDKKIESKLFYSFIFFVSIFWMFDGLVQLISGHDLFGVPPWPGDGVRIVGPFAQHLRLSLFLSITIPLVLFRLKGSSWIWTIFYLAFVIFIILLSGVRTDLLTALIAIGLYVISNKKVKLLLALMPLLLVVGMLASNNSSISDTKLKTFSSFPSTYQQWNTLSSYRLDIWLTAKNMFIENPIVGVGAKSFSDAYDTYATENNFFNSETVFHAHHPMISIAAETGIIGLSGFFTALFLLYKWGRRSLIRSDLLANPWFQILILMFFPIQSMPLLFTLWWFPVVALVILFYLADLDKNEYKLPVGK